MTSAQKNSKRPLTYDILRRVIRRLDGHDTTVARDAAVLLVGFHAEMKRGTLVALNVHDVKFDAAVLRLPSVTVPAFLPDETMCPVTATRRWLDASGITDGPLFRQVHRSGRVLDHGLSGHAVAELIKRGLRSAGRDPAPFSGESLASGLAATPHALVPDLAAHRRALAELRVRDATRAARRVGGSAGRAYALTRQLGGEIDAALNVESDPIVRELYRDAYNALVREVEDRIGRAVRLS